MDKMNRNMRVRVGLVDSGAPTGTDVAAAAAFGPEGARCGSAMPDRLGHGGAVLAIVRHIAPAARLWMAQVFHERHTTTAARVAAAIDWLVAEEVEIINLSLGLREDRPALAQACRRALAAGVVLCAAAPARGEAVFPAAYAGVLRMTGDARCARHEFSCLMTRFADFGAHVAPPPGTGAASGASMGCAHMSAHVAALFLREDAPGRDDPPARQSWLREKLRQQAAWHGPERRT
jgi:hypothetical protein